MSPGAWAHVVALGALAAGTGSRAQDAPGARDGAAAPPVLPAAPSVVDRLGALAERHPDRLELIEIGKSAGGRPLVVAVVSERSAGRHAERPALLVAPELARGRPGGAAAMLALLERLLERSGKSAGAFDDRAALYVLVDPRPDLAAPPPRRDDAGPRVDLDRNFPLGWDPWRPADEPPGPYPLSAPESRALAEFLLERTNVCAALVFAREVPSAEAWEALGAEERDLVVLEGLADSAPRVAAARGGSTRAVPRPGGFAEFCYGALGAFVVRADPLTGPADGALEPEALDAAVVLVSDLAQRLPRLRTSEPRLERLGPDLWQVELELSNAGGLPTSSAMARRLGRGGPLRVVLDGARLLGAAVREDPAGAFRVVGAPGGAFPWPSLAGRETVTLRLVAAVADGGCVLRVDAARAAPLETAVQLP